MAAPLMLLLLCGTMRSARVSCSRHQGHLGHCQQHGKAGRGPTCECSSMNFSRSSSFMRSTVPACVQNESCTPAKSMPGGAGEECGG